MVRKTQSNVPTDLTTSPMSIGRSVHASTVYIDVTINWTTVAIRRCASNLYIKMIDGHRNETPNGMTTNMKAHCKHRVTSCNNKSIYLSGELLNIFAMLNLVFLFENS